MPLLGDGEELVPRERYPMERPHYAGAAHQCLTCTLPGSTADLLRSPRADGDELAWFPQGLAAFYSAHEEQLRELKLEGFPTDLLMRRHSRRTRR